MLRLTRYLTRGWLIAAGAVLLAGACSQSYTGQPDANDAPAIVRIAAASDLQFALKDVNAAFARSHPGITIEPQFGSSGSFSSQIEQGAPFDVFLSADVAYTRRLVDKHLADETSLFVYGIGRIVVWVPRDSHLDIETKGLAALADPAVRKVAIANPEHAPYGRAAEAALKSAGLYEAVKPKLVLGENVTQAAQFVQSGSADAGIIALSIAESPTMKGSGRVWAVPVDAYPTLEQGGVVLSSAANPAASRLYADFLKGPEGREILSRYGFTSPAP